MFFLAKRPVGLAVLVISVAMLVALPMAAEGRAKEPVLGSQNFAGPYGKGFGAYTPNKIYNGGSPSGLVQSIRWFRWGHQTTRGRGLGFACKPNGGYYRKPVHVQLRAKGVGHCPNQARDAYKRLSFRAQKKPGGSYSGWKQWAGAKTVC